MTPKAGDRIELLEMTDDPNPLPTGARGTVIAVNHVPLTPAFTQVSVRWDNGSGLMLAMPPDRIRILGNSN